MRVERRFPVLSSFLGHRPAQEMRCAAVANRLMSLPISATTMRALSSLIPGMVVSSAAGIYQRHRYAKEVRGAFELWSNHIEGLTKPQATAA